MAADLDGFTGLSAITHTNKIVRHSPTETLNITAGVLAGGEGQRMGGVDKGLQLFRGLPLVRHALAALAPQALECIVSANRNLDSYRALGVRVVPDVDGRGPLAGLAALLAAAQQDWLLCVPCDAPYLPADLAATLYRAARAAGADAAYLHDGEHAHPTFCLVRTHLAASAQAGAQREQGLYDWLREHGAVAAMASAPLNINTADELSALEQAA